MRIQSSHHHADRGLDAYFCPPEATASLLAIEAGYLPRRILEPAAGDGAIFRPLQAAGYTVIAFDIVYYGLIGCRVGINYLEAPPIAGVEGIVTNPPYKLALLFAEKALSEVPYLALLLRTNFLESTARLKFFRKHPPTRIWISSRRLPMMHRHGWQGRRAPSNTCYAWFVWDQRCQQKSIIEWFDWKDYPVPDLARPPRPVRAQPHPNKEGAIPVEPSLLQGKDPRRGDRGFLIAGSTPASDGPQHAQCREMRWGVGLGERQK